MGTDAACRYHSAMVALEGDDQVRGLRSLLDERLGPLLSDCDVIAGDTLRACPHGGWAASLLPAGHRYYALVEADASLDEERFLETMEEALDRELIATAVVPQDEEERGALRAIREACNASRGQ